MSTISAGIFKKVHFKKQSAQGTIATGGAATGQTIRRVTSTLDLSKGQFRSNEIRPSQQRPDSRHGVKAVSGNISGEWSCGTYQQWFESLLRAAAAAVVTTGSQTLGAAAGAPATYTRASGSFLTDGFRVGQVVRASGFAGGGAGNNNVNCLIVAVSALSMSVVALNGKVIATIAGAAGVTIATVGKSIQIPTSGHTRDYYTIEHEFADVVQSERFWDCVIGSVSAKIPPNALPTLDWSIMGLDMNTATSAYFSSPTAATSTGIVASSTGVVFINGTAVASVTNLEFTINGNWSVPGGVVGANKDPDIFPGAVDASGTVSLLFYGVAERDLFVNETQFSISMAFATGNADAADFVAVIFPNVKAGGATKDDGEKALTLTLPFIPAENAGATDRSVSTVMIQDSQFV